MPCTFMGMVLDAEGQKMSKTRGNTMDPLDLVEQYGTDALRFALTTGTAPGNNLRLSDDKLESARNFANKSGTHRGTFAERWNRGTTLRVV